MTSLAIETSAAAEPATGQLTSGHFQLGSNPTLLKSSNNQCHGQIEMSGFELFRNVGF
ncbi:hypothetical protein CBA19CS22_14190 [Caballeronia novacaledonica]|uniref:Uncharacterized protein n=1 Tax=Caballeronia novacaledonica TaxID=1544861 RepID=A0ACB5QSJ8_9BURK|nr:hypothetical protein CBA19CS22_14190 [Caballeronia novacaledonica]